MRPARSPETPTIAVRHTEQHAHDRELAALEELLDGLHAGGDGAAPFAAMPAAGASPKNPAPWLYVEVVWLYALNRGGRRGLRQTA
ncbi:MAG: hypothetical protein WCC36_18800 [Gammaproteobacteria bacterium]